MPKLHISAFKYPPMPKDYNVDGERIRRETFTIDELTLY